ncbi:hypothetical protein [Amycolatopsis sp. cmx-4-68]|uniref:hypothetical protein n=1 Tax=Amycolatopsis sp. cmx-4-68 TaxID=2790938 RepID=UPI00397A55DB
MQTSAPLLGRVHRRCEVARGRDPRNRSVVTLEVTAAGHVAATIPVLGAAVR